MRRLRSAEMAGLALMVLLHSSCVGDRAEVDPAVPVRLAFTTTIGLTFVHVPAGTFMMGEGEEQVRGRPPHEVRVRAYYVARECVNVSQFEQFIANGHEAYRGQLERCIGRQPRQPVDWICGTAPMSTLTYACAEAFAAWLSRKEQRSFAIISEAEHERVMRSDSASYPWMVPFGSPIKGNWAFDAAALQTSPMENPCGELFCRNTLGWFPNPEWTWTRTKPYQYPSGSETDPEGGMLPSNDRMMRRGSTTFRSALGKDREAALMLVSPVLPQDQVPTALPTPTRIPIAPVTIASPLQAQTLTLAGGIPLRLYRIPAQSCTVGRPKISIFPSKDVPATLVRIPQDYWLGATEVTQAQYVAVTGATNPSYWKGDDLPVHNVTMQDILRFCDRLTEQERAAGRLGPQEEYRLPTEAEWECAARAGSDARWVCGDDPATLNEYAWVDLPDGPKPVGRLRPNAWGFQDMAGNVLEVVADLLRPLGGRYALDGAQSGGGGGKPGFFAARGGSWRMGPLAAQTTLRRAHMALGHTDFVGFRLARGRKLPTYVAGDTDYRVVPPRVLPRDQWDEYPEPLRDDQRPMAPSPQPTSSATRPAP